MTEYDIDEDVEDGLGVRYGVAIVLVSEECVVPTILVSGHECMTAPVGPVVASSAA